MTAQSKKKLLILKPKICKKRLASRFVFVYVPQTVLATVGVLADLLEGRWSQATTGPPVLALKT